MPSRDIIPLKPEPKIAGAYSYQEGSSQQPMFLHPCIQFLSEEEVDFIQSLPKELQATPGRYYIKSRNETDVVRLYVGKCPDGTIQNIKQARCEQRPGQDLETICMQPDKLTGQSKVEMIRKHLQAVQEQL